MAKSTKGGVVEGRLEFHGVGEILSDLYQGTSKIQNVLFNIKLVYVFLISFG